MRFDVGGYIGRVDMPGSGILLIHIHGDYWVNRFPCSFLIAGFCLYVV